jgi:hypothetical protein
MSDRVLLQQVSSSVPSGAAPAPHVPARPRSSAPAMDHSLMRMSVTPSVRVQAELEIGAPDEPLEREADEVADAVMRMPEPSAVQTPTIQRACADCEEEKVQRMGEEPEEDEALQAAPLAWGVLASASGGLVASGRAATQVAEARQGGVPLSTLERDYFQPRLGHDLSAVRVHAGPEAAQAAAAVGARAFTVGPDIVFGAGQAAPTSEAGRRLLAHELTHVIQQGHAPALSPEGET